LYREVLGAAGDAAATPGADLAERLAAASVKERRQLLEGVVRETVGKVLSLPPARIDPRRVLGSMGLGSLAAMELRNRLEAVLRRPLSATLAWNYPTVEALSAYLAGEGVAQKPDASLSVAAVELIDVAALSDEEALLALRGSRAKGRR
jgi:myxalamid-type polyketide synthase MxaE and MxaD